ncbi:D-mannonate dehydratase [Bacteriophage Phi NF-1]|uniref:D-mannonate dehydratase n=1 Tax=Bacteriophage Phi NF-1 TaxID=2900273 RepID=A0A976MFZ4_9CAUD|nr:D-mannonate dehydratase [Bacteriophage Phi NF-1]
MTCSFNHIDNIVGKMHDFLLWSEDISAEEWKQHSDIDFIEALRVYADEVEFWLGE